jgi:hypothetical protein
MPGSADVGRKQGWQAVRATAFDQGNLARQVTWLRQLAYNGCEEQRWQIFSASHHDKLTCRLIELLWPPDRRSPHVIDFTGWRPTKGPTLRTYATRPQASMSNQPPEMRLEAALAHMWSRFLGHPTPSLYRA